MPELIVTLLIKGFAIYYLAEATVELLAYIGIRFKLMPKQPVKDASAYITYFPHDKPLNCQFCMSFWWAVPIYFVPTYSIAVLVPASAGMAVLLWNVIKELDTFEL